jgi:hypothetical protein
MAELEGREFRGICIKKSIRDRCYAMKILRGKKESLKPGKRKGLRESYDIEGGRAEKKRLRLRNSNLNEGKGSP